LNLSKIPKTDSIEELAKFWDSHDLTEFEDEMEEVRDPVFDRGSQPVVMRIRLRPDEMEALKRIAESRGINQTDLVQEWVSEKFRDL